MGEPEPRSGEAADEPREEVAGDVVEGDGSGEPLPEIEQMRVYDVQLRDTRVGLGRDENGRKYLVIGPIAIRLYMPLPDEVARELGAELQGGIVLGGPDLEGIVSPAALERAVAETLRHPRRRHRI